VPTEIFADRPVFPSLEDLEDEYFYRTHEPSEQIFNGKIQGGSEMIPAVTDNDLAHMPVVHFEKE